MEIRGIGFAGSHTTAHVEMGAFLRDVLGLQPIAIERVGAELFAASNGDVLAVAPPYEEDGERTIADRRHSTARSRAACAARPTDQRERLLALPTSGCRTGSCTSRRGAAAQRPVEPEVQLGQRPLRPRRQLPRHEGSRLLARGRSRVSTTERAGPMPIDVERTSAAVAMPAPVLLPDPVADHPSLVGRPAHRFDHDASATMSAA